MNINKQIIAIAELDGRTVRLRDLGEGYRNRKVWEYIRHPELKDDWCFCEEPAYLTSRDAIIPVIEKQLFDIKYEIVKWLKHERVQHPHEEVALLVVSAETLCEALLRATGKWEEGD